MEHGYDRDFSEILFTSIHRFLSRRTTICTELALVAESLPTVVTIFDLRRLERRNYELISTNGTETYLWTVRASAAWTNIPTFYWRTDSFLRSCG